MNRPIRLLLLALLLGGCAGYGGRGPAEPAPPPPGVEPPPGQPAPDATPVDQPRAATLALLDDSRRAAERGDTARAISIVERAIRIEPGRAESWLALARLHLADDDYAGAEQLARKAITMAGERLDVERDAWLVVAAALEARGETERAAEIRERWRTGRA